MITAAAHCGLSERPNAGFSEAVANDVVVQYAAMREDGGK